ATVQFQDQSTEAVAWYWEFGDGSISREQNPEHAFTEAGAYTVTLTITDANGCNNSISYGNFLIIEPDLKVPNVFSPNGDGKNDFLVIDYTGNERYTFEVIDRWGRRVYRTDSGSNNFWDGKNANGNNLPVGVYYYTLILNGEKVYKGEITLLR
ncbi:MAG: gliding motility-associated C-terminal domain-containing protein, partial [Bacteroidota bacterium]